ncbi:helix-turn-helix domain-containing protein [Paenibacillus macquariensis]|uniref:AraC-type DNA-binding protein n=1 Tax=Paenibacillus macquariensis TaxID=948756 RepID=A0ABY1K6G9_9BACL|nr:helix-turn-helix domain-containing protein [Paenibacillus macquariensis]MEC0093582.1 helix-turn-helix domain-containing protein [Paenibacillus macquariensis]OAB35597.1 AraC family transcriptional regulator [Paenibacillus macquariensis subsp. macquariensis]SIR32878.1 AraC-type DNA-binding protein [Paenibacillus macquariensis]
MKMNYFKSKLFLKYILSYLFILLIPLVLITVFIYENAVSNLRAEIENSHLNQLTQTKNIIDARMNEMSDVATRISYDERLTSYRVHDPYFGREAIQALDQYKAPNSIISEIFLYFHNNEQIYSSQGMSSLDVFTDKYRFDNWTPKDLNQDLNSVKFPTMRPADLLNRNSFEQTILAYLVPITPNSPSPHATVMYFIKEAELTGLIDSILGNYQGLSYIFDNNGQILTDNRQGESLMEADANSLFGLSPGIHSKTLNGKQHSIVSVKSENNGWTYVTLMPSSQFFSSVLHVRSFIIMLFSIVVLVGAAIAIMFARIQYQPISTLAEFAYANAKPNRSADGPVLQGNELERIRTALLDYSSRVDLQEPYARNHFLFMLLKYGNAQSQTPELLETFDLQFDRSHHFVMVIMWGSLEDDQNNKQDRLEIIQLFTQMEIPDLDAYAYSVELPQPDQLALIISFNLHIELEEFVHVQHIVEAIRGNILEMVDVIPSIGVGTCYLSPDHINQSFIEACSASELRMSTDHGTVTFFEKLSYTSDQTFWIPDSELLKLSQSLKQGSYDVAAQIISPAFRNLHTLSALLIRCICFDILNTMLKTASELGNDNAMQEMAPNLMFNSLDELEHSFLNLASRICAQVERNQTKRDHSLMDQVIVYIDNHYMDHTLSLETISFEFDISPSHVSRSFKDKMGVNFIPYIWQKRMEEVMHQLTMTNDPLKDIIMRVGYLDTPNFIRKFKKETGYTPGQYRKLHKENELIESTPDLIEE